MNIEETKEAIKVMQAFVDGKPCEWRCRGLTIWKEIGTPSWDFVKNEYRIKPEPKDIGVNEYAGWNGLGCITEAQALVTADAGVIRKAVHYREVVE